MPEEIKVEQFWKFYWRFKTDLFGLWPSIVLETLIVVPVVIVAAVLGGPLIGGLTLAIPLYSAAAFALEYRRRAHNAPHKGRLIMKEKYARIVAKELRKQINARDGGLIWGKVSLPMIDAIKGLCVVGVIGAGKSLTIKIVLFCVLKTITRNSDVRMFVIDLKGEYLPFLLRRRRNVVVFILNPFDVRSVAWDIAADITNVIEARDLALEIAPPSKNATHRFFEDAIVAIATHILSVLIQLNPGRWTLRQFLLIMRSDELITKTAALDQSGDETVQRFMKNMSGEGRGNVLASVTAKCAPWEAIAACAERARHKLSFKKWLQRGSESVIDMGNYEGARHSCDLYRKTTINFIAKCMLSLEDSDERRLYGVADEATEAGEITGLMNLTLRGRSTGYVPVWGFQEIMAMYDTYGRDRTIAMVAQSGNLAFLRAGSKETAEWASGMINDTVKDWSNVQSDEDKSRAAFPPEYFMNLPSASRRHGLSGVFTNPSVGCWPAHYSPQEVDSYLGAHETINEQGSDKDHDYSPFIMVPPEHMILRPWSEEDSRQYGIDHPGGGDNGGDNDGDDWDGVDQVKL